MSSYNLVWFDTGLEDFDEKVVEETKRKWQNLNEMIYFNDGEGEVLLKIIADDNIEAQQKALKWVEKYGLEIWCLAKTESILNELVELK